MIYRSCSFVHLYLYLLFFIHLLNNSPATSTLLIAQDLGDNVRVLNVYRISCSFFRSFVRAEDCKPLEVNEATRWKPKSLNKGAAGEGGAAAPKLSTDEVLMKANAVLNKVC